MNQESVPVLSGAKADASPRCGPCGSRPFADDGGTRLGIDATEPIPAPAIPAGPAAEPDVATTAVPLIRSVGG